jgi:hypothetical protein
MTLTGNQQSSSTEGSDSSGIGISVPDLGSNKGLTFSSHPPICPAFILTLFRAGSLLPFVVLVLNKHYIISVKLHLMFDKLTLDVTWCISGRNMICIKLHNPHCEDHKERGT